MIQTEAASSTEPSKDTMFSIYNLKILECFCFFGGGTIGCKLSSDIVMLYYSPKQNFQVQITSDFDFKV